MQKSAAVLCGTDGVLTQRVIVVNVFFFPLLNHRRGLFLQVNLSRQES